MTENQISNRVIGIAIEIHKALGPGLLESAYEECLYYKLKKEGFTVEKQKMMPLLYEDIKLDCGYRIDLLVNNKVVVELRSVEKMNDVYFAQTLTYLKLGDYNLGLLINFNVVTLRDGIRRVINGSILSSN